MNKELVRRIASDKDMVSAILREARRLGICELYTPVVDSMLEGLVNLWGIRKIPWLWNVPREFSKLHVLWRVLEPGS